MTTNHKWLALTAVALISIALLGAFVLPGTLLAQAPAFPGSGQATCGQGGYGYHSGMMGRLGGLFGRMHGYDCDTSSAWGHMMGGRGWMGGGMMGTPFGRDRGERLTLEEAEEIAAHYAENYESGPALEVREVMEFDNNFYAEIADAESGAGAFELLIDPYNGAAYPEPGPNMMWNTTYGMHSGSGGMMGGMMGNGWGWSQPEGAMTITPERARSLAQDYLDQTMPGVMAGDEVEAFPGYYTLHTLAGGSIEGMLSVNGYSGQVWYHNWHGDYIRMSESAHE